MNAVVPWRARGISRVLLVVALLAGLLWTGWAFWALLLYAMGAWVSLPVPEDPPPSKRACGFAAVTAVTFGLSFMPAPIEIEGFQLDKLGWVDAQGQPIDPSIIEELRKVMTDRLDRQTTGR